MAWSMSCSPSEPRCKSCVPILECSGALLAINDCPHTPDCRSIYQEALAYQTCRRIIKTPFPLVYVRLNSVCFSLSVKVCCCSRCAFLLAATSFTCASSCSCGWRCYPGIW